MIKAITITNYLGESITIDIYHPELTGYIIRKIEGLGPPTANVNSKELSTTDGSVFNSARATSRNIVLTLAFYPVKESVESLRQRTYKYMPIKRKLRFLVESDNRIAYTDGYVESNEPDIFSEEETAVISIICPDAFFYSGGKDGVTSTVFSGIEPMFQFPFPLSRGEEPLNELSRIKHSEEENVYYAGDSEIGIVMTIHVIGPVKNITIYKTKTRESMIIDTAKIKTITGKDLVAGDDIIISTVQNDMYAKLLRNGEYTNILNAIDKNSDWFLLSKGDNIFAYNAEEGALNLQFRIENQTIYEGI